MSPLFDMFLLLKLYHSLLYKNSNNIINFMNHRRYIPQSRKPQPIQLLPFRNNHQRLKQIYQGPQIFKDKNKDPSKRDSKQKEQLSFRQQAVRQSKQRPQLQQINLAQIKANNRYRQAQKQQRDNHHGYQSHDNQKLKSRQQSKEQVALTSRHKDESSVQRNDLFKIRRKSISGSLKKKIKQQTTQYLSANPVLPVQLNYFQQGRKMYKEGKISEALRLFELHVEKQPQMSDGYYYSALCYLNKHNYSKANKIFTIMLQKFPRQNKKTLYLFAAIAAKNINQYQNALRLISQGISHHPDYLDLYLYRAKLFLQDKKYEQAHQDYQNILKRKKDSVQALFNNAICLKAVGKINNCLSSLNSAFYSDQTGEFKPLILLERIKIYISQKKYKQSKKDIAKLQQLQPQNCQLHYYKGLLETAQNNKKAALLSFERCIRSNTCKEAVASSLIQITKSKIEDRDFYSANYHISRSTFLQISTPEIQKFKLFAEGIVFMMKRKINEGIQNFYKLQNSYKPIGPYFQKLYYLYRAYGHFMQNKHTQSIKDYQRAEIYTTKDKYISYNQLIAEGIVAVNQHKFQQALAKFDQAQSMSNSGTSSLKIQPYIYRAMTFIQKIKANQSGQQDDLQTLQQIFIALKELDQAYDISDSNSNMLYLRSLIYMYLNKTDDALQDIIKAISKSQENVAKYFYFRALAHQTMNNKKQALNDFNICVNLDQKFSKVYLQRAKLLFSNDQAAKGLEDLQKYKQLQPNSDCKLIQCCLFYVIKQYDLAESCLELINDKAKRRQLQILIKIKQMQIVSAKQLTNSPADAMISDIMMGHWSVAEVAIDSIKIFSRVDYYCYLGIKYYHLGQYEESVNHFSYAIKEKGLMDLQENNQNNYDEQEQLEEQDFLEVQIHSQTKAYEQHYLNYNLFLAYLASKDKKKAYQIFIRDILPAKQHFLRSETMGALSRLLFQTLKFRQGQKEHQKQTFQLVIFRSLIGETADQVQIELPNFILKTKLCYPMPYAKQIFAQYSAKINPAYILYCLKISEVQNKPQPPWVKRSNQDLVFTDDVIDINIEFQTTEQDQSEKDEDYDGEGDEEEAEEEEESREEEEDQEAENETNQFDPRKFREQMKLDDDIERKLQKIIQVKKE